MSAATDARLANRILRGLVYGAVAGVLVLVLAPYVPGLQDGARWVATNVFDPLGQVFLRLLFLVVVPSSSARWQMGGCSSGASGSVRWPAALSRCSC